MNSFRGWAGGWVSGQWPSSGGHKRSPEQRSAYMLFLTSLHLL